jgi:hypothetical protein
MGWGAASAVKNAHRVDCELSGMLSDCFLAWPMRILAVHSATAWHWQVDALRLG